jgi:hypothetical protein
MLLPDAPPEPLPLWLMLPEPLELPPDMLPEPEPLAAGVWLDEPPEPEPLAAGVWPEEPELPVPPLDWAKAPSANAAATKSEATVNATNFFMLPTSIGSRKAAVVL